MECYSRRKNDDSLRSSRSFYGSHAPQDKEPSPTCPPPADFLIIFSERADKRTGVKKRSGRWVVRFFVAHSPIYPGLPSYKGSLRFGLSYPRSWPIATLVLGPPRSLRLKDRPLLLALPHQGSRRRLRRPLRHRSPLPLLISPWFTRGRR